MPPSASHSNDNLVNSTPYPLHSCARREDSNANLVSHGGSMERPSSFQLVGLCETLLQLHLSDKYVLKAFKHAFTSPSSADKELKATRSGNACLHGMTCVMPGSIAYIATQVLPFHFCSGISTTHLVSGVLLIVRLPCFVSHKYHHRLWEVLYHHFGALIRSRWKTRSWCAFCLVEPVNKSISSNEKNEHSNFRQVFPTYSSAQGIISKNSTFAKIKERRRVLMQSTIENPAT